MTISPEQLAAIMVAAKLTKLPEPPKRLVPKKQTTAGKYSPPDTSPIIGTIVSLIMVLAIIRYLQWKAAMALVAFLKGLFQWFKDPSKMPWPLPAEPRATEPAPQPAIQAAMRLPMPPSAPARTAVATAPVRSSTVVRGSPSLFSRRA